MNDKLRICLIGIGRTGQEIARTIMDQDDLELVMAVCKSKSDKLGKTVNDLLHLNQYEVPITSVEDLEDNILKYNPDVAIDFSSPTATLNNVHTLSKLKIPVVIGTTGFSEDDAQQLIALSEKYQSGIIHAPNITQGVNVLMMLTNLATSILESYDCEIVESHFKEKKDAPSGTAKKIALEALKGQSFFDTEINHDDYTQIPIHAIRAGGIIGSHKVVLAGQHDKLEITHESFSRTAFALGAIRACKYVVGKKGFYTMRDVLDMKKVMERYITLQSN